jgi:hypothetical protein
MQYYEDDRSAFKNMKLPKKTKQSEDATVIAGTLADVNIFMLIVYKNFFGGMN